MEPSRPQEPQVNGAAVPLAQLSGEFEEQGPQAGTCDNPASACGMWRLRAHLTHERDGQQDLDQRRRSSAVGEHR
jgi:hypothetical protein